MFLLICSFIFTDIAANMFARASDVKAFFAIIAIRLGDGLHHWTIVSSP